MLEEVREMKEKASRMRRDADCERDQSHARFEAKCREVERLEERLARGRRGGRVYADGAASTYSQSVIGEEEEATYN